MFFNLFRQSLTPEIVSSVFGRFADAEKKRICKKNTNPDFFSRFVLFACGGGNEIRTRGLRVANAALYQLSHTPDVLALFFDNAKIISYFFIKCKRIKGGY